MAQAPRKASTATVSRLITAHAKRILATSLAAIAILFLLAPASLGANPGGQPRFDGTFKNKEIFSTRALIYACVIPERISTTWQASYSEHPTGPWTAVNGGEYTEAEIGHDNGCVQTPIGALDEILPGEGISSGTFFLRGLRPATFYYARFTASNADGAAEEVVPFKTLPITGPEVDPGRAGYFVGGTSFASDGELSDTVQGFKAKIDANGASTEYAFEYSTGENGPWHLFTSSEATGTIPAAEEYRWLQASISGLAPETKYYVRLRASNSVGETVQGKYNGGAVTGETNAFVTGTAKPTVGVAVRNVVANSAFISTSFLAPHGSETHWALEYATEAGGPWSVVPGGSGTVPQSVAEAEPYGGDPHPPGARLTGLSPSHTYYVRAKAENTCRPPLTGCGAVTSEPSSFTTEGPPSAGLFTAHAVHGEALRVLGSVNPNSSPTSTEELVTIEGATGGSFKLGLGGRETESLPYDASADVVKTALQKIDSGIVVEGESGGPYIVSFNGQDVGKVEPLVVGEGAELTPATAKVDVASTVVGGVAYETNYRFEYVSAKSFAETGWTGAQETGEVDAGSGSSSLPVGADLPGLTAGETYRYKLVAQSEAPGTGPVESEEQLLTVLSAPVVSSAGGCPNEVFRVGLSAVLPDCRSYEQVTPVEKNGAQEPFHYGGTNLPSYLLAAPGGGRALFSVMGTEYVPGPGVGQSPFLFSRLEGGVWGMLGGTAQPEAGVRRYNPQVYSSDLTSVALSSDIETSSAGQSSEVSYEVGPVGGPYTVVESVPRKDVEEGQNEATGWVAGNPSLSKVVLRTRDHELLGQPTGTKSGPDLYEYTATGGLAQLNVGESGATVGACGASVARGFEDGEPERIGTGSSSHSVSAAGARVFFTADPGTHCGQETENLYMRVNGSETIDIGAYLFLAANAEGTQLLLHNDAGGEAVLYDTESGSTTPLAQSGGLQPAGGLVVASNLSVAYYVGAGGNILYRYDIQAGTQESTVPISGNREMAISPDGRFVYFQGAVGGLPGGAFSPDGGFRNPRLPEIEKEASQLYRYDSQEHVVQCISCASPYDPEPREPAFLNGSDGRPNINGALPLDVSIAGDGDYAFFTTPAALVKEDVDGETPIIAGDVANEIGYEYGDVGNTTSPSSDIYEWRADGIHGCTRLSGCLALLTAAHGGYLNLLLGSADEGRDVYIYTREKLLPGDNDTAGDLYDVREGGGVAPPPPPPTECEADSCAQVPSAPLDPTPASLTSSGFGNVLTPSVPPANAGAGSNHNRKVKKKHPAKKHPRRGAHPRAKHPVKSKKAKQRRR